MSVIAIDPGKKSTGVVVMSKTHVFISCVLPWYDNAFFCKTIHELIKAYDITTVLVEQQVCQTFRLKTKYFEGYMQALGVTVTYRKPCTYGFGIKSYACRKQTSVRLAEERASNILIPNGLKRIHDICDAFNIGYDYLFPL